MADRFQGTVESLFKGMENFLSTKSCVGDPIYVGDTIILPLVDVSFGMLASTKNEERKANGGGGMGGKLSPSAMLIIKNGTTRLVNIKHQEGLAKVIDLVPELIERFTPQNKTTKQESEAMKQAAAKEKTFDS